jgi:hypothetical protein
MAVDAWNPVQAAGYSLPNVVTVIADERYARFSRHSVGMCHLLRSTFVANFIRI